ncbi:hypothetical protein ACJU26_13025 [Acidithiobacillus sp. M4-SHS-6]|uniref:hypothetical protein n=1 Tax=Acidithiobacillus sp. M4-SHS-6 TaxID=3383024 RepID=UPI0039BE8CB7
MSVINLGDIVDSLLGTNGYGAGLLGGDALLGNLLGNGGESGLLGGLLGGNNSGSGLLGGLLGNSSGSGLLGGLLGDLGLESVVNPGSGNMATSSGGSVTTSTGSSTTTSTTLSGGNLLGSQGLLGGLLGIL